MLLPLTSARLSGRPFAHHFQAGRRLWWTPAGNLDQQRAPSHYATLKEQMVQRGARTAFRPCRRP